MKRTMKSTVSVLLVIVCLVSLVACNSTTTTTSLWDNALYLEDTAFGEGEKTAVVDVCAEDKTVTFTVNTDKNTVGDALFEHGLIDGEDSEYGLYIKKVNGITADYDVDQSYWAFYIDGEYATSGVDTTEIAQGATYRLEYTK